MFCQVRYTVPFFLSGQKREITESVCNLEQTNLSSVTLTRLVPLPSLITLDLSYLSLTRALPVATALLTPQGQILALVKPLFEVENSEARRTGHIEDSTLLVTALQRVIDAGAACGLVVQGVAKLALQPRHGVHEFFVSFVQHPGALSCSYDAQTLLALIAERGIGRTEEE